MTDRFQALRLFARVAHTGSFSAAGRELGLSQPSASRIVAELEKELGAALVIRTTRAVKLTEAGSDYLARIEPILASLDEADQAARGDGELRGVLRIGVSSSFSVREVIPLLPAFLARHPHLRISLAVSDVRQDLVTEGVDLAFRLGALTNSTAIAKKLGQGPRLIAGSPTYLRTAPVLHNPSDLAAHTVILGPGGGLGPDALQFAKSGRRVSVQVDGRVAVDANEAAIAAALTGLGLTVTSLWACRAELERGDLVHVLSDWTMEPIDLHAIFPAARVPKPAARAFADYFGRELRRAKTMA
jgi:DNA-binding transcriptional LysR family regulator